jgi:hypothetical protein
VDDGA